MSGLPTPYGTAALEPPAEVDDELDLPEHHGERFNFVNRCMSCGGVWPCEASETEGN